MNIKRKCLEVYQLHKYKNLYRKMCGFLIGQYELDYPYVYWRDIRKRLNLRVLELIELIIIRVREKDVDLSIHFNNKKRDLKKDDEYKELYLEEEKKVAFRMINKGYFDDDIKKMLCIKEEEINSYRIQDLINRRNKQIIKEIMNEGKDDEFIEKIMNITKDELLKYKCEIEEEEGE